MHYFNIVHNEAKVIYVSQTQWVQGSHQHYFLMQVFTYRVWCSEAQEIEEQWNMLRIKKILLKVSFPVALLIIKNKKTSDHRGG